MMKKISCLLCLLTLLCLFMGCEETVDPNDVIAVEKAELVDGKVVVTYADGYTYTVGTIEELALRIPTREDGVVSVCACPAIGSPGIFRDIFGSKKLIQTEIDDRGITRFCVKIDGNYYGNFSGAVNDVLYGNVTELVIPETADGKRITEILPNAYQNFVNLRLVTIPASITTIDSSAFQDCESLTEIRFGGTVEQWKAITKGEYWDTNTGIYVVHCTDGEFGKI